MTGFFISDAWAEAAPQQGGGGFLFMIVIFFVLMYFMIIRPQTKQAKEHRQLVQSLSKGDEIMTSGGLLGRIRDIGDNFILLEISEKVEIRVQKASVSQVMPKGSLKHL